MFGWSAVQPNCSRNVVLAWKQSVRSNWSNAKIRRPNLHLIFQNTTEPISTKIDSYRASTSAFHLGVQDPSVAYREASCIATFKVSECTWLNLYFCQRFAWRKSTGGHFLFWTDLDGLQSAVLSTWIVYSFMMIKNKKRKEAKKNWNKGAKTKRNGKKNSRCSWLALAVVGMHANACAGTQPPVLI